MTTTTQLARLRARVDRLPAAWTFVVSGFLLQFALDAATAGLAAASADVVGTFTAVVDLVVLVLLGFASIPVVHWLRRERRERLGASVAITLGVVSVAFTEAHPSVLLFAAALLFAGGRTIVVVDLDAADLLALDPERFERVDPDAAVTDSGRGAEGAGDTGGGTGPGPRDD